MENKDREVTGFDYLWCALYASAAFAIELLLLAIEGKIGFNTQNLTTAQSKRNILASQMQLI